MSIFLPFLIIGILLIIAGVLLLTQTSLLGSFVRSSQFRILGIRVTEEYAASGVRAAGVGMFVIGIGAVIASFF